jgi:uncharacterized 2Fe-2S/4Fe-4S cluster protein (DUF4445 family)
VLRIEVEQGDDVVVLDALPGRSFLHVLFEAGVGRGRLVCGGSGLCGKCRIRFVTAPPAPCQEDLSRLGAADVAGGWRLACRHVVTGACRIACPDRPIDMPLVDAADGVAVDIGTTRIKWALERGGEAGPEYAMFNPQMAVGSEVMSRLRYALSSARARSHLRESILAVLRPLVLGSGASAVAVAGNSTMISLLLDVPMEGLAYAPYGLSWSGGCEVGLDPSLPPVYVPPLLGPFIGADISAGLACIAAQSPRYPYVLADLGTNGEFVLALDEGRYVACSVPMGPAIEGVGLCCGETAAIGVVSRVDLGPAGLRWLGGAKGISGTGYVSLLALLRRLGIVDRDGHFAAGEMPLARREAARVREHPLGRIFALEDGLFLAERDIEEFLKAKAGVNAGLKALVSLAGLSEGDVRTVYLAGALGEHAVADELAALGFLPEIWRDRVQVAGNTSLAGTLLALREGAVREWLGRLPGRVRVESLVERDDFAAAFMRAMRFGWE